MAREAPRNRHGRRFWLLPTPSSMLTLTPIPDYLGNVGNLERSERAGERIPATTSARLPILLTRISCGANSVKGRVPQGIATSPGIPTAQGIAATQGAASTGHFQSHGIFGFRLEGSSQNMYNDNFRDLPSSAKLTNGATRSDFITTNSIDGYGTADVSRQQFFVLGSFGQVNYLKNNQFDGNPLSFAGGINWQMTSRCSGDLQSGIATRQQSDFAQLSTPVVNTVQTVNYEAHGLCNIGHEYSISVQGQRQESVNSNAALQLANLDQNRAKTKLLYGQPSVGSLGAEFAYIGSNYPTRSLT